MGSQSYRPCRRITVVVTGIMLLVSPLAVAQADWETNGPEGGRVLDLAFDPVTSGTVYAGIFNNGDRKSVV